MTIPPLLPAALALLVVSGSAFAQAPDCPQFFPGGQPPALMDARLEQRTTMLCNDAYAVLASGITHGAVWSAEHPTSASLDAARDIQRRGEFHADDQLPPADQGQLDDYLRSGFDRGHMTPSGDMPDEQAQQQTFSLANMVPQTAELNRGIWEGVESAVRHLASREGELYLVTGPAFKGERIQSIGSDGVLVPSSTWKAVYDPRAGGAGVYVCRNTTTPSCDIVSVATLVRSVGIDPFPGLPRRMKETAMLLPEPEDSPYAPSYHRDRQRQRETRSLLEQLFDQ